MLHAAHTPMLYLCSCLIGLSTSITQAGIISLSGDVEMLAPPFSVQEGAVESDSAARLILEREGFVLPSNVNVDITSSGIFDEVIELTPGSISAGTLVNSYLIHADSAGFFEFDGTIVSAEEILGVIVTEDNLQASHAIVGSPSTTYPVTGSVDATRAPLFLGGPLSTITDRITLSLPDTLVFHLDTVSSGGPTYDHVRIITAAVPEPSTLTMLAIGVLTLGLVYRRRSR